MSANAKRSQRARRSHYRIAPAGPATDPPAGTPPGEVNPLDGIIPDDGDTAERLPTVQLAVPAVRPPPLPDDQRPTAPGAAIGAPSNPPPLAEDPPTIILSPAIIAQLNATPPSASSARRLAEEVNVEDGYNYAPGDNERAPIADPLPDAPTIVLDVAALLAVPPPVPEPPRPSRLPPPRLPRPVQESSQTHVKRLSLPVMPADSDAPPSPNASWPRRPVAAPARPFRPGAKVEDPDDEFARLRSQRIQRESATHPTPPEPRPISAIVRQWWRRLQPGLDRVMGRAHRSGLHALRSTASLTSASLSAVKLRSLDDDAPSVAPRSSQARQIGARASTAALPALQQLHSRAERVAQRLVEKIDERLGSSPPMRHVLLGPGRMIVAFAPGVSIRNAQIVIAGVQARPLRRLIGYNAYLVLVPPGRESRYAERLHSYREVTGVHFGSQRA